MSCVAEGDVNVFNFLGYTIHCVRENVPIFRTIQSVFIMTFHLKPQMSDTCRKGRGIANFCGNKSDVIFHKVQSFDLLAVLHQKSGDQDFSCGHNGYFYQMSRQSIPQLSRHFFQNHKCQPQEKSEDHQRLHYLGAVNICTQFSGRPSKRCHATSMGRNYR